jgi:TRAP-type mannitol/chloroaromatic compound transport system substrate-binding protein
MNSKIRLILTLLSLVLLITPTNTVHAQKKVLIKLQSVVPLHLPVIGPSMKSFANKVKEISREEIVIELYDPGNLVPTSDLLKEVSKGDILQAGFASPGHFIGEIPAAVIFASVPFGPEVPEFVAWWYYGNGAKLHDEMYAQHGLKVIGMPICFLPPETSGWFQKKINTVEDLKGLKMRFYGLGSNIMEDLGASVMHLPADKLYTALETGEIDATEFSMPAIDVNLGFYKIAKYNYYPGWHQQATAEVVIFNKDLWNNKLTKVQRLLIDTAAKAAVLESLAEGEGSQAPVIKENTEKRGVKNMYWSDECLNAFKSKWDKIVQEQCAKDAYFKKVWYDFSAFRTEYSYWNRLGFLPRPTGSIE